MRSLREFNGIEDHPAETLVLPANHPDLDSSKLSRITELILNKRLIARGLQQSLQDTTTFLRNELDQLTTKVRLAQDNVLIACSNYSQWYTAHCRLYDGTHTSSMEHSQFQRSVQSKAMTAWYKGSGAFAVCKWLSELDDS